MQAFIKFLSTFLVILILQAAETQMLGCTYENSVHLWISQFQFQNGSYLYQNHVVPENLISMFNHKKTEEGFYNWMHLRGCVCELMPCITICCRFKHIQNNGDCNDGLMEKLNVLEPYVKVTLNNGSVVRRKLLQDFIILRYQMRHFDDWQVVDSHTLYEVGPSKSALFFQSNPANFRMELYHSATTKRCLQRMDTKDMTAFIPISLNRVTQGPLWLHSIQRLINQYFSQDKNGVSLRTFLILILCLNFSFVVLLFSEISLILTIAIYLCVKNLRSLQGKCFISYLVCTFISLAHLWRVKLDMPKDFCSLTGYFKYFFFLAKFIWLFIMHHRLWKGLATDNRLKSPFSFLTYSVIAWGLAALMTGFIVLIDLIWEDEPNKVKWLPGVGYENCDLKLGWISHNAYVLAPVILLFTLSAALFILTTFHIIKVKRSLRNFVVEDVNTTWLRSKMETYNILVRLFIVMVLDSSARLIVLGNDNYNYYYLFIIVICYYIDYSMGIIIFVMFILRCRMFRLL
ncbi:hypothetical protein KR032_001491, partial [Drosophila birchii]